MTPGRMATAGRIAIGALAAACVALGAAPPTLDLDPARSTLTFVIHRPGETIEGTAPELRGTVHLDLARLEASSVEMRVAAAALQTGNGMRDRKMRQSHLEVERHPEVVFRSTTVLRREPDTSADLPRQPDDSAAAPPPAPAAGTRSLDLILDGVLSLHGVDRPLRVPAAIRYDAGAETLVAEGTARIRLSDFGIARPRFLWILLDDEVVVRFRMTAAPAARANS